MATVSGMGFSGYDYIGSFGEGLMNQYWNRKAAKDAANLNYSMAQKYAENSPAWTRTGLENAGYNPMLAVSGDLSTFGNGNIPVESAAPKNNSAYGFDKTEFEAQKAAKKLVENEVAQSNNDTKLSNLETDISLAKLHDEAEMLGLSLPDRSVEGNMGALVDGEWRIPDKADSRYKQLIRNAFDRDNYLNTRAHAIFEDGISSLHGLGSSVSSAFNAYNSYQSGREKRERFNWFRRHK